MKKPPKRQSRHTLVVRFRFDDGSETIPLTGIKLALHRQYHAMANSDAPRLRIVGRRLLEATAQQAIDGASSAIQSDSGRKIANNRRKAAADQALLDDFSRWQASVASVLKRGGAPMSASERVRRYKIARRPLADRSTRRLNALLKAGRIPALK